jgi:hypothetical protein
LKSALVAIFHRSLPSIWAKLLFIVAASLSALNAQSEEINLTRGAEMPLAGSVVAKLVVVEVHRVQSDDTIDLVVVIGRIGSGYAKYATDDGLVRELGEFCLRYGPKIADGAIPKAERAKLHAIAPLYEMAVGKRFGFAFKVVDGKCSLEPPFPKRLVNGTVTRSKMAFD